MRYPLRAKNAIRIKDAEIAPGDLFDAGSKKERDFFLNIGAGETVEAPVAAAPPDDAEQILERIAAAQTIEELEVLIDEGETRAEIIEAATARWSELSGETKKDA